MIELVISGGQSGADQAALRAAHAAGIPTGGWAPRGWLTEEGPRPELGTLYGLQEHASDKYPPRTRANVRRAELTIVFDTSRGDHFDQLSRGSQLAVRAAMDEGREIVTVKVTLGTPIDPVRPARMAKHLAEKGFKFVNIVGNRESKTPGIGAWVEAYLAEVFAILKG